MALVIRAQTLALQRNALAVVGMIYYSHAVTKPAPAMTPSGSQNGIASGKA